MELVEGDDARRALARGPIAGRRGAADRAQIADALEARARDRASSIAT